MIWPVAELVRRVPEKAIGTLHHYWNSMYTMKIFPTICVAWEVYIFSIIDLWASQFRIYPQSLPSESSSV